MGRRTRRLRPDAAQADVVRRRLAVVTGHALRRSPPSARKGWVPEVPAGIRSGGWDDAASGEQGDGSALLDRLPLTLRAAAEALPAGLRRGRFGLAGGPAVVLVAVVLLGLAAAAFLLGWGRPQVVPVDPLPAASVLATGTPIPSADGSATAPASSGPAELVVHVAGKVRQPGVVRLPVGSRVLDALEAAGGAEPGVDLTGLNLARQVGDGEQVLVGVAAPAGVSQGGAGAAPDGTSTVGGTVNLNTATLEQLDTLPGIGPTLAERILQWREQHGRFTSVDELQEVTGIGPKKFEELVGLATV
jgi:competence protein ComEA